MRQDELREEISNEEKNTLTQPHISVISDKIIEKQTNRSCDEALIKAKQFVTTRFLYS